MSPLRLPAPWSRRADNAKDRGAEWWEEDDALSRGRVRRGEGEVGRSGWQQCNCGGWCQALGCNGEMKESCVWLPVRGSQCVNLVRQGGSRSVEVAIQSTH
jgi:hypothetical protein